MAVVQRSGILWLLSLRSHCRSVLPRTCTCCSSHQAIQLHTTLANLGFSRRIVAHLHLASKNFPANSLFPQVYRSIPLPIKPVRCPTAYAPSFPTRAVPFEREREEPAKPMSYRVFNIAHPWLQDEISLALSAQRPVPASAAQPIL